MNKKEAEECEKHYRALGWDVKANQSQLGWEVLCYCTDQDKPRYALASKDIQLIIGFGVLKKL